MIRSAFGASPSRGRRQLLSIRDLQVAFRMGERGAVTSAPGRWAKGKGVSFDIPENTTVALVGESGSGKSVTAMSILNLLPDNAEREGRILWQGRDLLQASRCRAAGAARQGDRLRLPGPDELAEPGVHRRRPAVRAADQAPGLSAQAGAGARRAAAGRGRHARAEAPAGAPIRTSCPAASSSA
jgi:energy-coupling factor transporter ATP-binding protein EcfA2